jgi:hypothetical protein
MEPSPSDPKKWKYPQVTQITQISALMTHLPVARTEQRLSKPSFYILGNAQSLPEICVI